MTLAEDTELKHAIAKATAAYEAATAVLRLLPASVRWADKKAAREYLNALQEEESAAWRRYLNAVQISHHQAAALRAAADKAERSLFVVASIHEGTTAQAA